MPPQQLDSNVHFYSKFKLKFQGQHAMMQLTDFFNNYQ